MSSRRPIFKKTNYLKTNLLKQIKKILVSDLSVFLFLCCKVTQSYYILQDYQVKSLLV